MTLAVRVSFKKCMVVKKNLFRLYPALRVKRAVLQQLIVGYNLRLSTFDIRASTIMKRIQNPFKWRHHQPDIILLCVRWYCRFQLSYRDLEEMMRERGLAVDHTTVWRWVMRYAPDINKRLRPHLKLAALHIALMKTTSRLVNLVNTCTAPLTKTDRRLSSC